METRSKCTSDVASAAASRSAAMVRATKSNALREASINCGALRPTRGPCLAAVASTAAASAFTCDGPGCKRQSAKSSARCLGFLQSLFGPRM